MTESQLWGQCRKRLVSVSVDQDYGKIGNEDEEIREEGIPSSNPKGLMDHFRDWQMIRQERKIVNMRSDLIYDFLTGKGLDLLNLIFWLYYGSNTAMFLKVVAKKSSLLVCNLE